MPESGGPQRPAMATAEAVTLETERLRLRPWTDADLEPFARLNADPEVMRHFPATLSRAESDAMAGRIRARIEAEGWGFWAVEARGGDRFIGFTGLIPVRPEMPFAPAVEVGWRLARAHWGRGYATEAARAALAFGFRELRLETIVSFTALSNRPSYAVMERLGMQRIGTFEHPSIEAGHALRPHWLYRLQRADWERTLATQCRVAFPCGTFTAREVLRSELPELQRFYEENPGYFERVHGEFSAVAEAADSLEGVPPPGWAYKRKYLLALRDREGRIVAVADVIADLFTAGVWHIGFFLAADRLHGSGVPHALYAHLEAWMRSQGASWIRLGVVRGNGRAQRFWAKMGYIDVAERRDYLQGAKRHTLRVMMKPLAGGSVEQYRALVERDRPAEPTPSAP